MHSHNLPLLAVLWLPAALVLLRRIPGVAESWRRTDALTRAVLLLMAVAAAVHLALIPAHAADPITAVLFALDACGLIAVGVAGLLGIRGWRVAATLLLLGAVGAYAAYVVTGREVLDLTGIATKVDELAAVELLLLGWLVRSQRLRFTRTAAAFVRNRGIAAELRNPG